MKFYQDTWDVIDNYFSTTPYYLTKHHLDSYNDFISNKVLTTVRVLNDEFFVIKNENNGATTNEINVYIGGKEGKEVFINKPTIVENGHARLLYPNEARLRDLTYQSELYANIYINIRQNTVGQNEKVFEKVFKNVKIGALPIMLHSKLCVLHNQPKEILREMGECPYDQGGYFIVDGKEKVIVAQERIATNRIFINKSKDVKYSHEGLIRCTSAKNPLFPKTTYLYVNAVRENSDMIDNAISINLPRVNKPIPICVMFRALGVESDKDIFEYITYDVEDIMNKQIIEFVRYSILDNRCIYTQEDAMKYIASFSEYKNNIDNLKYTLVNDLFPNVGNSFKNKAVFLGHIVRKIVKVALGIVQETDRDDYKFKRVDISGFLLGNLFRDYYNQFRNVVRNNIDKAYNYGPWKTSGIENLVNKTNLNTIFQSHILADGLRKSLKGSWGKLMMKENLDYKDLENIKQEVVQDLNRFSYAGTISHLRRCNTPLDPTATKLVGPHKLHTSQWGIMCPIESPDGASIGLLKNFAIFAHVTFDVLPKGIEQFLEDYGMIKTQDIAVPHVKNYTKILINSNWIGVIEDAPKVYKLLKLMKRNSLINIYTSVSWDIINAEINIMTESGRCCRPTYVVNKSSLVIEKFMKDIKNKNIKWIDLIKGDLITHEEFNPTFDEYIDPKEIISKRLGKTVKYLDEIINILETTQAAIEYADVEETNGHLIAMDGEVLLNDNKQYTHCEIHPSTILSAVGVNTPYSDHNQAPRNIFSTGQCKQAIGVFATNFNSRIDTMTYVMNYPQRPICSSRYGAYTNFNTMVNGQNLIVAIATYTGYNQEDSIIFNKTSVERGMFNLTYYKNMTSQEEENKKDNEVIQFGNPLKMIEEGKNLTDIKFANYQHLDENGFPKVNSYIHEGDAIIGRCKVRTEYVEDENSKNNIFNNKIQKQVFEDKSIVADKTVSGIIDRVFVYFDDNNTKKLKIRFRKNRDANIGDKNCCYDDKTEILTDKGWILFKELTKEHNVASMVDNKLIYQNPIELQEYDFNGDLYKVDTNHVNLLVTDNHRMYVKTRQTGFKIVEAKDCEGRVLHYKKNIDIWEPCLDNLPEELIVQDSEVTKFKIKGSKEEFDIIVNIDDWLVFFGIWMAKEINKERVESVLDIVCKNMEFSLTKMANTQKEEEKNNWFICKTTLSNYMQQYSVDAINKYLPEWVWFLNKEQCRLLIDSMCLGGGHTMQNGTKRYDTSSTKLADDLQRLCLHAGYSSNKCLKEKKGKINIPTENSVIQNSFKTNTDAWRLIINTAQNEPIVNKYKYDGKMNDGWEHYEGKVYCCTVPKGDGVVYVRRNGRPIWSGNSRAGQKGVCGALVSEENLPFTKDGLKPDIIINPHAIPSRMTIGHLFESVLSKYGAMKGSFIDATPFNHNDYTPLYDMLENDFGMERYGNEIMYNGFSGEQIATEIFIGPTFYLKLKHMVLDKINYRSTGPRAMVTRQPVKGRSRGGAIALGNMETAALWSHGAFAFLNEGMMDKSDKFQYSIDNSTGNIACVNKKNNIYKGYSGDGVLPSHDFSTIETPYAFKLLSQELMAMSLKPTLYTQNDYLSEGEDETYEDAEVVPLDDVEDDVM
jgi:DNA-directed RNA polymerase II subunit RPB2